MILNSIKYKKVQWLLCNPLDAALGVVGKWIGSDCLTGDYVSACSMRVQNLQLLLTVRSCIFRLCHACGNVIILAYTGGNYNNIHSCHGALLTSDGMVWLSCRTYLRNVGFFKLQQFMFIFGQYICPFSCNFSDKSVKQQQHNLSCRSKLCLL